MSAIGILSSGHSDRIGCDSWQRFAPVACTNRLRRGQEPHHRIPGWAEGRLRSTSRPLAASWLSSEGGRHRRRRSEPHQRMLQQATTRNDPDRHRSAVRSRRSVGLVSEPQPARGQRHRIATIVRGLSSRASGWSCSASRCPASAADWRAPNRSHRVSGRRREAKAVLGSRRSPGRASGIVNARRDEIDPLQRGCRKARVWRARCR